MKCWCDSDVLVCFKCWLDGKRKPESERVRREAFATAWKFCEDRRQAAKAMFQKLVEKYQILRHL